MVYLLGEKPAGDSDPRTEGGVCQIGGWIYSGARLPAWSRLGSGPGVTEHVLLIVEERLREQEAEGVRMPEGMEFVELALRVLIAAETGRIPCLRF
jgi:hypothetical protein